MSATLSPAMAQVERRRAAQAPYSALDQAAQALCASEHTMLHKLMSNSEQTQRAIEALRRLDGDVTPEQLTEMLTALQALVERRALAHDCLMAQRAGEFIGRAICYAENL